MGKGKIMKSECKGCLSYSEDLIMGCEIESTPYRSGPYSKTRYCPCLNCLVKGVCEDSCQDLENYQRWLRDDS